ncbi:MAG: molybdenum cofactor guanylyltransferase [Gammaproteobacteria bacterium]|nr:molybdenum cofactor guanylyltransferase [Gammaproteobacteria bacterium]
MALSTKDITVVVLAGGKGRRMGGQDKGLLEIDGRPMIRLLLDKLTPQTNSILINANRNTELYREFGYPVVPDSLKGYQGPLAGFLSAMAAASTPYILTLPCDGPLIPADYVSKMAGTLSEESASEITVAHDGKRMQPVYALIPVHLQTDLEKFLSEGERKIDLWYSRHQFALADFSHCPTAFRNINTPQDRDQLLGEGAST